jgi:predicted enzyme related to lactoylglutathione lyase
MIAPLNRIIIYVGDVETCANFYRDVFGFTALPNTLPAREWLELETGGCRLAFIKAHGPDGPINSPTGGPTNPHKIVFFVEDVFAARAELIAKGAKMGNACTFGSVVLCDGSDPEGHVFQLSNRR